MQQSSFDPRSIPGWGADLNPANRPGVPREHKPEGGTGAHWKVPEQQEVKIKVLRSTEHDRLPPVFGTSCPPKGLSGVVRTQAFRLSEGKKAHWLLLLLADRIDVLESSLGSALRGRPDNPFKEMGLKTEFRKGGFNTRFGQHRADLGRVRNSAILTLGVVGAGALLANRMSARAGAAQQIH